MLATIHKKSTVRSLEQELTAAGDGLAGNAEVLRSVLAGCGDCIKILDLDGRLQFMSEGGKRVMEVEDFGKLKGCPWPDFWAGQGNVDAKSAVATAISGGTGRFRGPANTAKGTPRYWDVQVSSIVDGDGRPTHLLSISRDITEEWNAANALHEAAERQAMLTQELEHRIKNTLATVSAIANQTMQGDALREVREAFTARLITLGRAHDILTRTSWTRAPIREVVEGALAPHRTGQGRIRVSGPEVELQPKQALGLALAVHELATNALKYGALSNATGTVDIVWSTSPRFAFTWLERGGPPVVAPSTRGFGTRMIERMFASDFSGNVTTSYGPEGFKCDLLAPTPV
jgi:two-component sensor histidine kinase